MKAIKCSSAVKLHVIVKNCDMAMLVEDDVLEVLDESDGDSGDSDAVHEQPSKQTTLPSSLQRASIQRERSLKVNGEAEPPLKKQQQKKAR